jgi:aminoglycoside 6'-N-acetyltransferase
MITLRPMTEPDLSLVEAWMQQPRVARWWLEGSTLQCELEDCVRSVRGEQATNIRLVLEDGRPIGWCQWYRYSDYPDDAPAIDAAPDEVGIDYAIGEPAAIGHGLGAQLVSVLVAEIRAELPGVGIIADPSAANLPSRRVLEHNGFEFVEERLVEGVLEAVYRLPPG